LQLRLLKKAGITEFFDRSFSGFNDPGELRIAQQKSSKYRGDLPWTAFR
jgi:hypothetical protein